MIQTLEEGMKDQSKRIKIPEKIRPFDVGYRIVNKHGQALALKNGASIFALPSLAEKLNIEKSGYILMIMNVSCNQQDSRIRTTKRSLSEIL